MALIKIFPESGLPLKLQEGFWYVVLKSTKAIWHLKNQNSAV